MHLITSLILRAYSSLRGVFRIPSKKMVFLGGTCNGSNWRDELIPYLELNYFNPVVDNWTEKNRRIEEQKKEQCDFCLYLITPEMTGVYSIAEAVQDSIKRPEKVIFSIIKKYGDKEFTDAQYKSLMAVAKLIQGNGGKVLYGLISTVMYLNEKAKA